MKENIADIRTDYTHSSLDVKDVNKSPFKQFELWFDQALSSDVTEPNAMNLATVGKSGVPSCRVVLLKGLENDGFVFYTNYQSKKGREMDENPTAALNFFWPELQRQVQIKGTIEKVSAEESTKYFQSRPKASQIGAWTSPQSTVIKDREILEDREKQLSEKHKDDEVLPRPKQWGGYVVKPFAIEFWQGRPSRLHDRIVYTLDDRQWKINRLAP